MSMLPVAKAHYVVWTVV